MKKRLRLFAASTITSIASPGKQFADEEAIETSSKIRALVSRPTGKQFADEEAIETLIGTQRAMGIVSSGKQFADEEAIETLNSLDLFLLFLCPGKQFADEEAIETS